MALDAVPDADVKVVLAATWRVTVAPLSSDAVRLRAPASTPLSADFTNRRRSMLVADRGGVGTEGEARSEC